MSRMLVLAIGMWVGLASAQDDRLTLARKLSGAGQHIQAIAEYQKALEKNPGQSQLWMELAETRMSANQPNAAMGDFARAVRLEPTNLRAQRGLATASEKSGNLQRALLEWRRTVQLTQGAEQADAETNVDRVMGLLGQAPDAKLADTPKSPMPTHVAATPAKVSPASVPSKVKSNEADPADVKKAVQTWKEGGREKALEMLRGIIKIKPTTDAYYYAGLMRYEEKKFDMAEFNLKKAVGDKELAGSAWYWLGRTLEDRHKSKDAKVAFKRSIDLSPRGEYADEARSRLEPEAKKNTKDSGHPATAVHSNETIRPELSPPLLPDSLRNLYSWTPPVLKIPPGDGSAAGKHLDDAAKQMATRQNDLALSSLEQMRMKESASPSAELVGLASAVVYNAMGLSPNALGQLEGFLKDHPGNPQAEYAKFVLGISLLRAGRPDSASKVLGPLAIPSKNALWTESARQSALGEALRLTRRPAEALAALRLAFQGEPETKAKRSIALRMAREAAKAGTPEKAAPALSEVLKACDKSNSCLQVEVTQADLLWNTKKFDEAGILYQDITKTWPLSNESPWAMYQTGNIHLKQGKPELASADWKSLIERSPGSFWAGQARLRLEDAVWRIRYKEAK